MRGSTVLPRGPRGADTWPAPPHRTAPEPGERVLDLLRYETGPYAIRLYRHERLARLMAGAPDAGHYAETLAVLLGFYRPAERFLAGALASCADDLALACRAKAPLIARDLSALRIASLPCRGAAEADPPLRRSVGYALGWLYGVEIVALGGRVVARRVREAFSLGPEDGAAFFHGYGTGAPLAWRSFTAALARRIDGARDRDRVLAGAVDMLEALGEWLSAPTDRHADPPPGRRRGNRDQLPGFFSSSNSSDFFLDSFSP